jgi:ubiquinone/menaquinone biosynthesis C-methylase UbiE
VENDEVGAQKRTARVCRYDRAKWFDEAIKGHNERTEKQLASIQLNPEYTVLDVGAGTGRLAIPIAKKVKKVTG